MFTADNNLVSTNLAPQDTVYQMMGIVKRMQKLADRTVLLGEIRADLVEVDPRVASVDVQQLGNNDVSVDNAYNKPADYYDVINSCNVYLAYVDSLLKSHGKLYYETEVCAAKSFRAWCYLELAKIYGAVPLVTEPVLTADAAEAIVNSGKKADMLQILDFCIDDLKQYAYKDYNEGLRPVYGNVNYCGYSFNNFFIPVRALLAELYLWRGSTAGSRADYIDAIRMYHDYFCFTGEEKGTGDYSVVWYDRYGQSYSTSYNSLFTGSSNSKGVMREWAGTIACDTASYYGNTCDLRTVFNSQYANNYYPWVNPSQRLRDISAGQDYCYYNYVSANDIDTLYISKDPNNFAGWTNPSYYVGDLRFRTCITSISNEDERKYNSNVNDVRLSISKWSGGSGVYTTDLKHPFVPYFRHSILYLHLAEALNRAGFPETAFAILAHGLTYKVMNDRSIISQKEFDELCTIKSYGLTSQENMYDEKSEMFEKTRNSFVIWSSDVFDNLDKAMKRGVSGYELPVSASSKIIAQIGIHSRGSGDTEFNQFYQLDDSLTKKGLVEVPAKPKEIPLAPKPAELIDYETWLTVMGLTDSRVNQSNYSNYTKLNADSLNKFNDYPALYAQYQVDSTAYKSAVDANAAYLASAAVTAKRQAHVAELILDEEALEGSYEGYRFYDIMRYLKQEGTFNPSAIKLPEYIAQKYKTFNGATPWKDNMTGKPWYLTLPRR